jgi:hypothetical protein
MWEYTVGYKDKRIGYLNLLLISERELAKHETPYSCSVTVVAFPIISHLITDQIMTVEHKIYLWYEGHGIIKFCECIIQN